jgi:phospholipid/cholesterol/gamma-HCH transport system substrate-binding protein
VSRRVIPTAAVFIIVVAAIVVSAQGGAYTVRILFADAAGLRTGSLVEEFGQPVGSVTDLALTAGDRARATVELDGKQRIGAGASADVRPAGLLGERYIDLHPGDVKTPLPSGSSIPTTRTGDPVNLDDVVDVLDAPTRVALSELINESGIALAGRGGDFNALLTELPPALDKATAVVSQLAASNRSLDALVRENDPIVSAIDTQRGALGALVQDAASVLATTAAHARGLAHTVTAAPSAIRELTNSLARLQGTATALGPASDALRAAAPSFGALLAQITPFATAAVPTFHTASGVAPSLTKLGLKATPVIVRLQPLAADLTSFAKPFNGFMRVLQAALPDTLGWIEGWARSTQPADGAGHLFRNDSGFNLDALTALVGSLKSNRSPRAPRPSPAGTPEHRLTAPPTAGATQPRSPAAPNGSPPTTMPTSTLNGLLGYLLGR